jgi:F420-dependent oxidoreductase-like protein
MQRLGASIDAGRSLSEAVGRVQLAESLGFGSAWVTQLPASRDAGVVLAAYAAATDRIRLGTAVLPIYTRHPTAMAQLALTLDELSGGRFRLGIGVSHRPVVEGMLGLTLSSPAAAMREYLAILRAAFEDGSASVEGQHFTARWTFSGPRRQGLEVLVAALNPRMLQLAGELADGVLLWMCSPAYIRDTVVPHLAEGRARAGRGLEGFEIAAAVPVSLTEDPAAGRDVFRPTVARYAGLPFYRRMLDASGFAEQLARDDVSDAMVDALAGIGDAAAVRDALRRYREAGCTLPLVGPFTGHDGAAGFEATLRAALGA